MLRIVIALAIAALPLAAAAQDVPASRAEISLSFASVVKAAAPAVVNVQVADTGEGRNVYQGDPFLERFFGRRRQQRQTSAVGSGVIVDPSGLVVTNAHVVGNAKEMTVSFNDRREYGATLILKDERTDLAILKIEADGPFPAVEFAPTNGLEVGDLVLAIGNPFGVGQTVTQGIVSAVARTQVGVTDYRFFIQTDAAINPGNSGGALIDMAGRLIGINTAIYSRSGGSNGIGFAIPADMVNLVVSSAAEGRRVERPWFGARLQNMTRELAEQYALKRVSGVLVVSVMKDGPAQEAGIRVGDIVVGLAGEDVSDHDTFGYLFATRGVSGTVDIEVLRGGEVRTFALALEVPPETVARDERRLDGGSPFAGSVVMNLSPKVADELNMELSAEGVALAKVDRASIAERVGFKRGDIVLEINGRKIETTEALDAITMRRQRYWDIIIERDGQKLSLVLGR
ncbi:Do family serine endopeptidase [Acuticoccus sp. MNP-M23]|uniref:Do family serine endopeptidase n=1 Tax=Acuticoccus sp. MNP-M23 TaxID=3072793 RepID=UPI002814CF52|nr:Do family serine endopeptidase [Acuticoccus sp. MNP-M23]WMS42810.1 Do family serine endopeptidase [Acuticoccus sp. MNP-M23]